MAFIRSCHGWWTTFTCAPTRQATSNPTNKKSTEKIDGVVATIMALDRAIRNGTGHVNGSVYDERGLLFV
nr:hypothetical protein [Arcanobacterium phocae]